LWNIETQGHRAVVNRAVARVVALCEARALVISSAAAMAANPSRRLFVADDFC
jgi:hypothetical protein